MQRNDEWLGAQILMEQGGPGMRFPDDPRIHVASSPVDVSAGGCLPRPRSMITFPAEGEQYSVVVNKKTHWVRFENETESGVVVVIEPRE